jgi:hypothetical protein
MTNDSRVDHPDHYNAGPVECIDALQSALTPEEFAGFCKGNALKYIWREQHKAGIESLRKAVWYLERLIQAVTVAELADKVAGFNIPTADKFSAIRQNLAEQSKPDAWIPRGEPTVLLDMTHNGDGEG